MSETIVANRNIEKQEHSSVKLTVTIKQESLKNEYTDLLSTYQKSAHIKGFRKGKAPAEVLERKFGEGIRQEAASNLIEKSLKEIFEEIDEKPLPYVTPTLLDEELDADLEKDFTFNVSYDVFPEITLGDYKELEITEKQVKVGKEDLDRELTNLQERNAFVVDKADGVVDQDSIVTIDYAELDENDEPMEDKKREGFVFTVGSGYTIHKIDDDVVGMKKDETKVIEKEYDEDFQEEDLRGRKVKLQVTITAVKERKLPELDDDLAQDVSEDYETLEDLKKDINDKLKETAEQKVREDKINQLIEKIIENSEIDLPEGMISAELETSWYSFLQRSRIPEEQALRLLEADGKTKEGMMEEWRGDAERRLKTRLLLTKIIEEEKIETADNEIDEEIAKRAEANNMKPEELREQYEQANYMGLIKEDVADNKLFDFLLENAKISKGEKVNFLDLMQPKQ